MVHYGQRYNPRAARWATLRAFGRWNRKAGTSYALSQAARERVMRGPYPMPAGTREPVTIAGRPWERVWRADGTYECVPVEDGR